MGQDTAVKHLWEAHGAWQLIACGKEEKEEKTALASVDRTGPESQSGTEPPYHRSITAPRLIIVYA
jgi:hypothetical protein